MLLCLLKCWTRLEYRRYFRLNINCILEWRLNILVVWHFDTTLLYKCIKSGNTFNSLCINLNIVLSILNFTDSFNFLLRLFSSSGVWLTRPLVITDTLLPAQCRWLSLLVTAFLRMEGWQRRCSRCKFFHFGWDFERLYCIFWGIVTVRMDVLLAGVFFDLVNLDIRSRVHMLLFSIINPFVTVFSRPFSDIRLRFDLARRLQILLEFFRAW